MLQEKTVINDCYILQSGIGEDAYTEHWIATAIFSAKRFLLRFLKIGIDSSEQIAALRDAAVRSYHVRGPAISDFVELEVWRDRLFISSEYNDETSLLRSIEAGKQWSLPRIVNSALALADGLASFHALGIAYGNLNAESVIIIERRNQTPVMKIRKPTMIALLPSTGHNYHDVCESFSYLAPECKSGGNLSPASDIFSLGIHLVRLFTGRLPFPDNAETIRTTGPSLRYVAAALFRRNIPEALVCIVIRMLMRESESRFASCAELIKALRSFIAQDSGESTGAESPYPSYQQGQGYAGADYFASGSARKDGSSGADNAMADDTMRFPLSADPVGNVLEKELVVLPEEGRWSVDDYIEYGIKTAFGTDRPAIRKRTIVPAETTAVTETTVAAIATKKLDAGGPSHEETVPSVVPEPSSASVSPSGPDGIDQVILSHTVPDEPSGRIEHTWTRHQIRIYDVRDIIERSARRATSGFGSFRYIEEPREVYAQNGLFDLLETLGERYFYVNIGTCTRYGSADIQNFVAMLRKGLVRALGREADGRRRYLGRRLRAADRHAVFADARLDALLHVKREPDESARPSRLAEIQNEIVGMVRALGTKARPLVLIVRGGESITRDLHELLSLIASSIDNDPVAVFVFFGNTYVEDWHTLRRLRDGR